MSTTKFLKLGARISVSNPTLKALNNDVMRGTQQLLLKESRNSLTNLYKTSFTNGAAAVCTGLDTSTPFLDRAVRTPGGPSFWEDLTRDNDISYYKVGKGTAGVDKDGVKFHFDRQDEGYVHLVPRTMVSVLEKKAFVGLLTKLGVEVAQEARAEGKQLVGATVVFNPLGPTLDLTRTDLHRNIICDAAENEPDFFAIHDLKTVEDVREVADVMEANKPRKERLSTVSLTGFTTPNDYDTEVGWEIPTMVVLDSVDGDTEALVEAVGSVPGIVCIAAPEASKEELEELKKWLPNTVSLAGPDPSAGPGEVAILA